jgi:predicted secreted Zn-dependent protease
MRVPGRFAIVAVMAAAAVLGPTASHAMDPGAPMVVEHYDIRGTTWEELKRQIDSTGPEGSWGNANTRIQYKFQMTQPAGGPCAVTSVQVEANAKVSLPRWVNRNEGSASLQETWDSAYRALELHERGHVQINVDGKLELERALKAVSAQPTCDETKKVAHQVADRIISDVAQRQDKYDADTDHGRRQQRQ